MIFEVLLKLSDSNVLLYVKRAKVNAQGLVPIFQRIAINRQRLDNSTGKFVDPEKWHSEMSKMKGTSEEARSINGHLDHLKSKILNIEKILIKKDIPVNYETFKNELTGTKERERMLIPIFEEHNRKIEELLGLEYAPGTLERYKTSLKHTKDFLHWKYSLSDINLEKIDHAFIMEYEFYLRSVRKCNKANELATKYRQLAFVYGIRGENATLYYTVYKLFLRQILLKTLKIQK